MKKKLLFLLIIFIPFFITAQTTFRSGRFLHHSTGLDIWGPNGSSTSIPQQMEIYNSTHGYVGDDAVGMTEAWWPSGGNNEWELWNRIFRGDPSLQNIFSLMNQHKILVIKSCFPSSQVIGTGQPSDTLTPTLKTIYNYKWIWRNIVNTMSQNPDNFFAIWTNAPLVAGETNATRAALAKEFCTWAKDTLAVGLDPEIGAFPPNVYVFDFFSKLTDENGFLKLEYAENSGDSHPNSAATELIAPQFVNEIFGAAIAYEGGGSTLAVSPQNRNVSSSAGSTNFTVTSSTSWTAQSNATWCTVTASGSGNGTLTASYTQNTTGSSRTASISVSASDAGMQTVTVTQAAASTLGVSPQTQSVTAPQGSTNFNITSNTNWTAQSDASWCTVTPSGNGNGTLVANYTQNTSTGTRTASISVSASGAATQTVSVVQAGTTATLVVSPQTQNVTAPQGSTNFNITSNTNWTAQSDASWCTVTPSGNGNGTLAANYTQNTSTETRTASIAISASGAATQTVTVAQAGTTATLAVSPQTQNVGSVQGNTNFNVLSNTNWTAQSDANWCTVTQAGSGNGILTANYEENSSTTERTANILITVTGGTSQTVTVVQTGAAATLIVTPSSQLVGSQQGSTNFYVTSNTAWTAQSDADWCVVTTSGNGNGTLTASYEENPSGDDRTANISITAEGVSIQMVVVIQAGTAITLAISPPTQHVGAQQGSTNFNITSNTDWTAQSDSEWCQVTPSGNGNGTLVATFNENSTGDDRTANISVNATGTSSHTVTVVQTAIVATLAISPMEQNVGPQQGNTNFEITCNTEWTSSSDAGWCTPSASGNGNGTLVAEYSQNTSTIPRTASITVFAENADPITVTVIQAGAAATLAVSPQYQNVSAAQGSSSFNITSNTNWTASSNSGWCVATPSGNGSGLLYTSFDENTSTETRTATITILAEGVASQTVELIQSGTAATLTVSPPLWNVESEAGEVTYFVTSNSSWTAQSNAEWCTPTLSGNGNESMLVNYEANETYEARTAIMTISAEGADDFQVSLIQKGLITDIQHPGQQERLKIYPNPSKGLLTIETPDNLKGDLRINIINTLGEKLDFQTFRTNHSTFQIRINSASTGIHFIIITDGERVLTQKFILQ